MSYRLYCIIQLIGFALFLGADHIPGYYWPVLLLSLVIMYGTCWLCRYELPYYGIGSNPKLSNRPYEYFNDKNRP